AVVADQVVVERADHAMAEYRPGVLRYGLSQRQQRMARRAKGRALVGGRIGRRMPGAVTLEQNSIGAGKHDAAHCAASARFASSCLAILKARLAAGTPA